MEPTLFDLPVDETPMHTAELPALEDEAAGSNDLRPYQREAVEAIFEAWKEHRSTLLVLPTGSGKTRVATEIIQEKAKEGRVMLLAHTRELIFQAAEKIRQDTGLEVEIEMGDYWASGRAPVIVSSRQTQCSGEDEPRMQRWEPQDFRLLVVDEAHRAPSETYRKVIDHYRSNPDLLTLGITATPDRRDEASLGSVFDVAAAVYEINDLIDRGWLVPVHQKMAYIQDLDLSHIDTTAGDLNSAQLDEELQKEWNLLALADVAWREADGRRTLIFCSSVDHAEKVADILNRYKPDCARSISEKTPRVERKRIFADYHAGRLQFLTNVDVVGEGVDVPGIEVVVCGRPTESRAKAAQQVGRGCRPLGEITPQLNAAADATERKRVIAESAKPCLHVIDTVGNAGKHKLVTTADVLGGKDPDEVIQRANKKAEEEDEERDVSQRLDEARAEIEKEKEEQRRKEEAEREKRKKITGKAEYTLETIDPFDVFEVKPSRVQGWNAGKEATEKQVNAIFRMTKGKVDATGWNRQHASDFLDRLVGRAQNKWATYGQAKFLKSKGIDATGIKIGEATQLIDAIKANNWKRISDDKAREILGREVPKVNQ